MPTLTKVILKWLSSRAAKKSDPKLVQKAVSLLDEKDAVTYVNRQKAAEKLIEKKAAKPRPAPKIRESQAPPALPGSPEAMRLAEDTATLLRSELKSDAARSEFLHMARMIHKGEGKAAKELIAQRKAGSGRFIDQEHNTAVKAEFLEEILKPKPDMNRASNLIDELEPEFREQIERLARPSSSDMKSWEALEDAYSRRLSE